LIVTIVLAVLAAAIITAIGYLNVDKLTDWRAARKARRTRPPPHPAEEKHLTARRHPWGS